MGIPRYELNIDDIRDPNILLDDMPLNEVHSYLAVSYCLFHCDVVVLRNPVCPSSAQALHRAHCFPPLKQLNSA